MRIELDAPGPDGKPVPHWLSKPAPAVSFARWGPGSFGSHYGTGRVISAS